MTTYVIPFHYIQNFLNNSSTARSFLQDFKKLSRGDKLKSEISQLKRQITFELERYKRRKEDYDLTKQQFDIYIETLSVEMKAEEEKLKAEMEKQMDLEHNIMVIIKTLEKLGIESLNTTVRQQLDPKIKELNKLKIEKENSLKTVVGRVKELSREVQRRVNKVEDAIERQDKILQEKAKYQDTLRELTAKREQLAQLRKRELTEYLIPSMNTLNEKYGDRIDIIDVNKLNADSFNHELNDIFTGSEYTNNLQTIKSGDIIRFGYVIDGNPIYFGKDGHFIFTFDNGQINYQ